MFSLTIRIIIDDSRIPEDVSLKEVAEAFRMFAEALLSYYGLSGNVKIERQYASGLPEGWRVK